MKIQFTWRRLPQGFKDSSIIMGEALTEDLLTFGEENPDISLLFYTDYLLLDAETQELC